MTVNSLSLLFLLVEPTLSQHLLSIEAEPVQLALFPVQPLACDNVHHRLLDSSMTLAVNLQSISTDASDCRHRQIPLWCVTSPLWKGLQPLQLQAVIFRCSIKGSAVFLHASLAHLDM